MRRYYPVLTIAGSDSSGGAGLQADIKAISAQGCYAMTAVTAILAQNTTGIYAVETISRDMVVAQIDTVVNDIRPMAVKTGLLATADIVNAVAWEIERHNLGNMLVVDPMIVTTSGTMLLEAEAVEAMKTELLPRARLITPSVVAARLLTGKTDTTEQAECFREIGCRNILLKGGDGEHADVKTDLLVLEDSDRFIRLSADSVATRNAHGSGCSLSAAIAARMALGDDIETAVSRAKLFVTRALESGSHIKTGHGNGPVDLFFDPKRTKTTII